MVTAGLQQSMATREPNFEPRSDTMCLLHNFSSSIAPRASYSPNVTGNNLAVMRVGIDENVLDEIVAILVAGNCDIVSFEA